MVYLPENYYLVDDKGFDVEKAVTVTAQAVGQWCSHYRAQLIMPKDKKAERERVGTLPNDAENKRAFIGELARWLFANSVADTFALFLDPKPVGEHREAACKFDHHDDQCCWYLDLTDAEFSELQNVLRENGLPDDLFYPEGKAMKFLKKPSLIGKFLNALGFTGGSYAIYTPKQWEREKLVRPSQIA